MIKKTLTRIRHAQHIHQRLLERYQITATEEELVDLEEALNTLKSDYFYGYKNHSYRCLVEWKGQFVEAVMSVPAYIGNRRHLLTVLPK
jgi:hypothetical protein